MNFIQHVAVALERPSPPSAARVPDLSPCGGRGRQGGEGFSTPFDAPPRRSYSAPMATKTPTRGAVETNRRGDRVVTSNRRAFHDFHILETVEAGIVLTGTEIK